MSTSLWNIIKTVDYCIVNFTKIRNFHNIPSSPLLRKYKLDLTNVPVLNDVDLEEKFVHGSGPGGQSVNRTWNCVVLIHKLSGITVKCHETRSLEKNRKRAREILIQKLDAKINGENSVANQKKAIDEIQRRAYESRRDKLNKLKKEWKRREFPEIENK